MSLKESEKMLNYLTRVLDEIKALVHKPDERMDLSTVLQLIKEAKVLAKPSDKEILQELEDEARRLDNAPTSIKNVNNIKRIYSHFGAEIYMSKALVNLTKEQYNRLLDLIQDQQIQKIFVEFKKGRKIHLQEETSVILHELGLLTMTKKGVVLTESGSSLAKALELADSRTRLKR